VQDGPGHDDILLLWKSPFWIALERAPILTKLADANQEASLAETSSALKAKHTSRRKEDEEIAAFGQQFGPVCARP